MVGVFEIHYPHTNSLSTPFGMLTICRFLNAFWDDHEGSAERLWQYAIKCAEVDIDRHEEGSGLDEMQAHVFLEKFDEVC